MNKNKLIKLIVNLCGNHKFNTEDPKVKRELKRTIKDLDHMDSTQLLVTAVVLASGKKS